jgi:hypothetical protein
VANRLCANEVNLCRRGKNRRACEESNGLKANSSINMQRADAQKNLKLTQTIKQKNVRNTQKHNN